MASRALILTARLAGAMPDSTPMTVAKIRAAATSQGGIQALSRSTFGKLLPDKNRSGEFFGFYDIFGKFSAIIGPTLVGICSSAASAVIYRQEGIDPATAPTTLLEEISQRAAPWGVLSILIIFLIGGGLFFFVLPRYQRKANQERQG